MTRDAEILYPSMTISVMDGPMASRSSYTIVQCPQIDCRFHAGDSRAQYPPGMEKSWERHNGGANYLFCDGHAKWYEVGQVDQSGRGNQGKVPSFSLKHDGDGKIIGVDP